jgi:hypothetical protein
VSETETELIVIVDDHDRFGVVPGDRVRGWLVRPQGDGWLIVPNRHGKLPRANEAGADPVEMRAAELVAAGEALDFYESLGWTIHYKGGEEPDHELMRAGWLARQMTRGDS